MGEVVIRVQGMAKRYRLGTGNEGRRFRYDTLREALARGILGGGEAAGEAEYLWALKDVSFEVERGEVLGVIGPNGAGKSTLLKILSRITEPTEGLAELRGRVGSLLEVGTGFHPELTGRENIFLNGAILGMKRGETQDKFDAIVDFAEVRRFIDTPVKHYSSGMYLRLAFAVAAHLHPEILLVDEVLAVGDAAFQKKCMNQMREVTRAGRTILFVSHNMGAIESLCSRALWVEGGSIKAVGKPKEIVSRYLLDSAEAGLGSRRNRPGGAGEKFIIEKVLLKNRRGEAATVFSPGESILVEVQFRSSCRIEKPHLWIGISGPSGPLFGADMMMDGHCPEYVGPGPGRLGCLFKMPALFPQVYTVRMGAREKDAITFLTRTSELAAFRIEADPEAYGLHGPLANTSISEVPSLHIPYEWRLPDGRVIAVNPKFDAREPS